ncbi:hypothetical protein DIPPA_31650 [Diplonema papillatum]|nr:hypothetical protein DIPPA_31650 [Diplonema papillatum]
MAGNHAKAQDIVGGFQALVATVEENGAGLTRLEACLLSQVQALRTDLSTCWSDVRHMRASYEDRIARLEEEVRGLTSKASFSAGDQFGLAPPMHQMQQNSRVHHDDDDDKADNEDLAAREAELARLEAAYKEANRDRKPGELSALLAETAKPPAPPADGMGKQFTPPATAGDAALKPTLHAGPPADAAQLPPPLMEGPHRSAPAPPAASSSSAPAPAATPLSLSAGATVPKSEVTEVAKLAQADVGRRVQVRETGDVIVCMARSPGDYGWKKVKESNMTQEEIEYRRALAGVAK